jgi:histidinol-phosphate aminotransferase
VVGSGSTELIRLVAAAYFDRGNTVIIPQPSYGEYEVACRIAGARAVKQVMSEKRNFRLDVGETAALIEKYQPAGVFICSPNNPTGQYLSTEEVEVILSVAEDTLVVLDEAYIAFTEDAWQSTTLSGFDNLVILRSMTKDYALAGLRLGYCIASEEVAAVLRRVKPPWNISSVAQAAGIYSLNAEGYLDECRTKIKKAKDYLVRGLKELGLSPLPSQTNFLLVKVGDVAGLRESLFNRRILVRDCASFGLPGYIRLAPRRIKDCRELLEALQQVEVRSGG